MMNRRALPRGVIPKKVHGTRVNEIHGVQRLDQEVILEDISLPEFSPTQKIAGPVRATIFNNPDTKYDIIIGMDLM